MNSTSKMGTFFSEIKKKKKSSIECLLGFD